jgi:hypothetical protein
VSTISSKKDRCYKIDAGKQLRKFLPCCEQIGCEQIESKHHQQVPGIIMRIHTAISIPQAGECPVMKPVCHLLCCLMLTLALVACHSANTLPKPVSPPAPMPLDQISPPSQLGQWNFQGSIGENREMRIFRYLLNQSSQALDISFYPLPNGWQSFSPSQALERHFGMLEQQLVTRARNRYHATSISAAKPQTLHYESGLPVISNRFTSHFDKDMERVTLVVLTLYQGNFIRFTLTCSPDKADQLALLLSQARQALVTALLQPQATHKASPDQHAQGEGSAQE